MADTSQPRAYRIILVAIAASVALFFVTVGTIYVFHRVKQQQIHVKVELAPAVDLQNSRNFEMSMLGGYAWADTSHTQVRIPIERALELEARRPWRMDAALPTPAPRPKSDDGGTTHGK